MPKPVLSDSLFNAGDVATAVLAEANLQVANSDLGVTDKSSIFVVQSGTTSYASKAFAFNGFMFINLYFNISSPTNPQEMYHISDSDYYPNATCYYPTISYNQDSAQYIEITTSGVVKVVEPYNPSGGWNGVINGWYRFA